MIQSYLIDFEINLNVADCWFYFIIRDVRILIRIGKAIFILPLALCSRFTIFIFFIKIDLIYEVLLCSELSSSISFWKGYLLTDSCGLILVLDSNCGLAMPSLGRQKSHDLYSFSALKMEYYLPFHILKIIVVNSFLYTKYFLCNIYYLLVYC